jgi:hypothetical protein
MAYVSYNGWTGLVRKSRDTIFFGAIKAGLLPDKPTVCFGCGITTENHGAKIQQHSEEYGPLPEDYIKSCVPLCFRCHFLVHARFKIPNKWLRYLNRVASGNLQRPLPYDWRAGNVMLKEGDIDEVYKWVKTPNRYLSSLPLEEYSGPMKIVTVMIDNMEVPDPRIYVYHPKKGLIERKYTEAVANARIELSRLLELKTGCVSTQD